MDSLRLAFGKAQYSRRSAAERCVSKWKQYRAVATRYDKRDYMFTGTLAVAAIMIWLRDIVQESSGTLQIRYHRGGCRRRHAGQARHGGESFRRLSDRS